MKFAPRYDPRILVALRALDDPTVPIAETWRRVAAAAERHGLLRPSYVHLRRLLHRDREVRARTAARAAAAGALASLLRRLHVLWPRLCRLAAPLARLATVVAAAALRRRPPPA